MSRTARVGTVRMWAVLALLGATACDPDLRVPYIPPTLHGWPERYVGTPGLRLHAFTTGTIRMPEALLIRGGSVFATVELAVPVFALTHPRHGVVLVGTGLGPSADTARPSGLLGRAVPVEVQRGEALAVQLARAGIAPERVRWVILPSLRLQQTGGLAAFPNARVVASRAEREYGAEARPGYAPSDVSGVRDWQLVDFAGAAPLATFPAALDVLGDGSCMVLDARGATPGTLAVLVRMPERPVLLAGDLAAVSASVRYAARPRVVYDLAEWWDRIWRVKRFKDLVPALLVVPGYDLGWWREATGPRLVLHEPTRGAGPTPTPVPQGLRRLLPAPL